ncbi:DUF3499 domain-containing protein [Luteococcus japonicus]|uniref:DUF3499 domain-containing protein n=1 Tax=Luteococcus japonicus LSP_Lj1 TaxID=1255658 RepID=A0A1R4JC42_9ACTN|nr:DUF3499 domain-containing protein [Luteococcus japonicus]SJN29602.1 hypothetical protein FM114_06735 [Luteococcus japonicus LSP_Lj1]
MAHRRCTKAGCSTAAVATLTYVYADSTAVLGPLAPEHIPGSYDLCRTHCENLSAPRGWEVVRLPEIGSTPPPVPDDDLLALANAVREVGMLPEEIPATPVTGPADPADQADIVVLAEKRHLRVIADGERPRG